LAKVRAVGRTVEPAAGVAAGGTAIGCSENCEEWEGSGRFEVAERQPWDGQAVAHSAAGMAVADGMEVEDSELLGRLETQATAGSGGHIGCASSVAGDLAGSV